MGSIANYQQSLVPEAEMGIQIVKEWIHNQFYTLHPVQNSQMFLSTMAQCTFLAVAFDKQAALQYLHRAPSVTGAKPWPDDLQRRTGDKRVYIVHDLLDTLFHSSLEYCTSAGILFIK